MSVWHSGSLTLHPRQAFGIDSKCPDVLLTAPLFHIPFGKQHDNYSVMQPCESHRWLVRDWRREPASADVHRFTWWDFITLSPDERGEQHILTAGDADRQLGNEVFVSSTHIFCRWYSFIFWLRSLLILIWHDNDIGGPVNMVLW